MSRQQQIKGAIVRMGLDVQYYCIADPAGWDPIYGKSPVHLVGKFNAAALKKALKKI
jgi:thymidylate synthase